MNEIYSKNAEVRQQHEKKFEKPMLSDHIVDDEKPI